jgi:hypothetical protein
MKVRSRVPKCEKAMRRVAELNEMMEKRFDLFSQFIKTQHIKNTAGIADSFFMKSPVKK